MIINGFGGASFTYQDNWIDIPLVTYSGTTTLGPISSYSGSRAIAWKSTEQTIVWPDVTPYRYIRVKPNCMTFKTVNSTWPSSSASGSGRLGLYCSTTKMDSTTTLTSSYEYEQPLCFGAFIPNSAASAAGHNMLSWSGSYAIAYNMETKRQDYAVPYNHINGNYQGLPCVYTPTSRTGWGEIQFITGTTYYIYISFVVFSTGGMTSDITFSYSGSFILQGLPY